MIGIEAIGAYIPERRERNADHAERFALAPGFIDNKLGVIERPRRADEEETSDMCVRAFEALQRKRPIDAAGVDCLIVCTQNPDARGLPHTSAVVHGRLGVGERCAAFDVSLGCSGFVYVLSMMQSFMEAQGFSRGLLFTADPYSKIVSPDDKNTSLLFGDAAAVALLSEQGRYRLGTTEFGTRGAERAALENIDGTLHMNGRAIFNFAMTTVPGQIQTVLDRQGWTLDDVDVFAFHQASKYVLDTLATRLGIAKDKMLMQLGQYGNTVSSSIPLLLESIVDEGRHRRILTSGFGVGLSWATGAIERTA